MAKSNTQPYFSLKQKQVYHRAHRKINILSGSMTSGKTYITNQIWIDRQLGALGPIPDGDSIIVGRTLGTVRQNVINPILKMAGALARIRREDGLSYLHIGERRAWYVGADKESEYTKILGKTFADGYADELTEIPESAASQAIGRTRGRFFGTTNPGSPYHWLNREYISQSRDDTYCATFGLLDNPSLSDEQRADILSRLKGLFFKRYGQGLWVAAEGVIYDMFDPTELLPAADAPDTGDRSVAGIDYGTSNPCVYGYYRRHEGRVYKLDEWRWDSQETGRQKTDSQYADDFTAWLGRRPLDYIVCDPSAASLKVELRLRGYMVRDGDNDVLAGIRHTAEMLGSGRLVITEGCPNTALSLSAYSWDPAAQRRGQDKPLKQHDHEADETRYITMDLIPPMVGDTDMPQTAGVTESVRVA